MRLAVLGATGSIGLSTLDVAARHPQRFQVAVLVAQRNVERMLELCERHRPEIAAMADPDAARRLERELRQRGLPTRVEAGPEVIAELAGSAGVDCVVAGIVGAAGLLPTLAAVRAGKRVLLANKEALVMAGAVFMEAVRRHRALLLPLDSEHNAIFQCLPADYASSGHTGAGVRKVLLTASGGPFRNTPADELQRVTPEQACAHPNWAMGPKISVDSATMMNKGLELIEACWLFDLPASQIEVVVHPQSIVHSLVEYEDGSVLAQLGNPDMRTPIAYGLSWPERIDSGVASLDLYRKPLEFQAPDFVRFPCLKLAYDAARTGGSACAVLNAANEVAVAAFLEGRTRFTDIARVVGATLEEMPVRALDSLDEVMAADREARDRAHLQLNRVGA